MTELNTGDIILFAGEQSLFDKFLNFFTGSPYTHVGIVIKDPENLESGLYMLESGLEPMPDCESGKKIFGVQLHKLDEVAKGQNVYYRKLHLDKPRDLTQPVCAIDKLVHGKPYDINPIDWFEAELRILHPDCVSKQQTSSFWCSALVAYIYVKLGLLGDSVPWTLISPKEWGFLKRPTLNFVGCHLDKEVPLDL